MADHLRGRIEAAILLHSNAPMAARAVMEVVAPIVAERDRLLAALDRARAEPKPHDLVTELHKAVHGEVWARAQTPKQVWEQLLGDALVTTRARLVDAQARVAELEAAICVHREAIPGNRRRQADRTLHRLVEDS